MKDIQQNSPCSTGTYPLKKHNHMTSVSKRCQQWSCTNTYMDNDTVLLKFSSKLKKLRQMVFHSTWTHELRFGTTRALQYCYTLHTLHTLHTLPYDELNYWCSSSFLKTIGLIQKLNTKLKKCHCIFLLQINPHFKLRELEGAFIIL